MIFLPHYSYTIPDKTYLSIVKREINKLVLSAGFDSNTVGKIDIILSEMLSNLVKHKATGGEILAKLIQEGNELALEIICLDNGPGMDNVSYMMTDGVSTYGSKGEGLGAIKRLSDEFDIFSSKALGTGILSRVFHTKNAPKKSSELEVKAVCVPKKGEELSGDAWGYKRMNDKYAIIALDGLGHGVEANAAATLAAEHFLKGTSESPCLILKTIHGEIKKTRGAVGAVGIIDSKNNKFTFCGIGNISGKVLSKESSKSLVSYNGTIGYVVPSHYNDQFSEWNANSLLILHSDGIKNRWEMNKYTGLENCDSTLIAAIIYKFNTRGTDDNLVVVAKASKKR